MHWKYITFPKDRYNLELYLKSGSLYHCVPTCSGAHPASYPTGTSGSPWG